MADFPKGFKSLRHRRQGYMAGETRRGRHGFCCGISEYKNLRSAAKRTGVKMRVVENTDYLFA